MSDFAAEQKGLARERIDEVLKNLGQGGEAELLAEMAMRRTTELADTVERRSIQLAEEHNRRIAVEIVLDAVLRSIKRQSLDRAHFQDLVAEAGRRTPCDGLEAVRHEVLLHNARKVLRSIK